MGLEEVRQQCIAMRKFEEKCKANAPKGMVYKGMKASWFSEMDEHGWNQCGYSFKPVYEKGKDDEEHL